MKDLIKTQYFIILFFPICSWAFQCKDALVDPVKSVIQTESDLGVLEYNLAFAVDRIITVQGSEKLLGLSKGEATPEKALEIREALALPQSHSLIRDELISVLDNYFIYSDRSLDIISRTGGLINTRIHSFFPAGNVLKALYNSQAGRAIVHEFIDQNLLAIIFNGLTFSKTTHAKAVACIGAICGIVIDNNSINGALYGSLLGAFIGHQITFIRYNDKIGEQQRSNFYEKFKD